jgi:hypothetical protein
MPRSERTLFGTDDLISPGTRRLTFAGAAALSLPRLTAVASEVPMATKKRLQ